MVWEAFCRLPAHTNLKIESVRVFLGEDALYPDEDEDDDEE